jgi:hypothetical protein
MSINCGWPRRTEKKRGGRNGSYSSNESKIVSRLWVLEICWFFYYKRWGRFSWKNGGLICYTQITEILLDKSVQFNSSQLRPRILSNSWWAHYARLGSRWVHPYPFKNAWSEFLNRIWIPNATNSGLDQTPHRTLESRIPKSIIIHILVSDQTPSKNSYSRFHSTRFGKPIILQPRQCPNQLHKIINLEWQDYVLASCEQNALFRIFLECVVDLI